MVFLSNGKTTDLCILPLLSQNEYYSIRKKVLNNFRVKALSKFAPLPVRPHQDQLASNGAKLSKPSGTVFNYKIHSSTLLINLALKNSWLFS